MKISSANTNKVQFLTKSKSNPNEFQYKEKRIKNNEAVKKSRKKSKDNNKVTLEKVTEMKEVIILIILYFERFLDILFWVNTKHKNCQISSI